MRFITKTVTALILSLAMAQANAIEPFVVEDIQVEGLQRIELGTFFTALPIRVGETLDDARVPAIIRSLYKTGNFDFVKVENVGNTLKISVAERPIISSIILSGNKVLKSEQLLENMKGSGIAKGEVLNSFVLDKIEQAIQSEYFSNGHYHLKIDKKIRDLSRNRVQLNIKIKEGRSAKLKSINLIGNKLFTDEELLSQLELKAGGFFSFLIGDNKYSNQILEKDIQTLTSYYKDRGYLKFTIDNALVSLSDDKEEVYISLALNEGDIFKIKDIRFVGDLKNEESFYRKILPFKTDDTYSAALTTFFEGQVKSVLGIQGFTFAETNTITELVENTNEVNLIIAIDPGQRYYASNIKFTGNVTTDENVFRRESRIQEGEPVSSALIERTKLRMQRLPFIEDVTSEVNKTEEPGEAEIIYNIVERNSSEATFSLGYNDLYGLQIQGGVTNRNFLGQGKTIGLNLSTNKAIKSIDLNYSDPYFFLDTVGLSTSLIYKQTDFSKVGRGSVGQGLDTLGIGAGLFYPISETSSVNLGFNYQDNTLKAPIRNGLQDQRILDFFETLGEDSRFTNSVDFNVFSVNFGYQNSTLNRFVFPTSGYSHNFGVELATSLGDVEYSKANYDYKHYFPIVNNKWIFLIRASLGFGDGMGDTDRIPYFANYYVGGSTSLRGFETNTIGPKSIQRQLQSISVTNPFPDGTSGNILLPPDNDLILVNNKFSVGGNAKALASFELIFPTPFIEDNSSVRTSAFVDIGNVWDTKFDVNRFDGLVSNVETIPDYSDPSNYRGSYGISLQWYSPFAPLQFSFSRTFKVQEFDETKTFTFTIGQTF